MKYIHLSLILLFIFLLNGCQSQQKPQAPLPGFENYVNAYTSGKISTGSSITVHLLQPVSQKNINLKKLFTFSPDIKGEALITGERVVEFRPFAPLKQGTTYSATFRLGELIDTEPQFKEMTFQFSTLEQWFSVSFDGLQSHEGASLSQMQFSGCLLTADDAPPAETEKILQAGYEGKSVPIRWNHELAGRKHFFTIDSLQRYPGKKGKLQLQWNGNPISVQKKGEETISIPDLNVFEILDAKVNNEPEQHIEIRFSDPILKSQDLTGFVVLNEDANLRLTSEGNIIKAWPEKRLSAEYDLTVFNGIENINYAKLPASETFRLHFSEMNPEVRFIGKGVIVPQSETLEIPFEAIALSSVEVRVVQIFKENILTFFQANNYDGSAELIKAGRLVHSGNVDLTPKEPDGLEKWNTYKINLAELFPIEQGAIYNVQLRFFKENSVLSCGENDKASPSKKIRSEKKEPYQTEWDYPGWYFNYYYPPNYNWQERDNPCHDSYYNSDRFVSRNIFASQLGIIAKEGQDHKITFAVTNLLTTVPEQNTELRLFNYQNRHMQTLTTDNQGFASATFEKKPFFLIAQKGNQFGYLRLDDGSSLSTSNFNVGGQVVTDGLKGFIYGERGVWRPGDTIYLNTIIEKENAGLPENYPVLFELINPLGQVVDKRVLTENINGFYPVQVKTAADAPTGNWQAQVTVGNAVFSKRVKIETIKPNRLKIKLDLPKTALTQKTESIPLEAAWLHGSPARSLKAKVDVLFVENKASFTGFEQYTFTDPASSFSPTEQAIFEGNLGADGKTSVPVDFQSVEDAPGMLKAWFTTRVFEQGGDFSINVEQAAFAPYSTFVGVKMPASEDNWYKTDTDYLPEIVLVDANGKAVSGDDIEARLYKIDWRWWWESGEEYLAHYVSGNYYRPVISWDVNNASHKTQLQLNVKYNNWQDNGRYLLWVKNLTSGHASGVTFYMSQWGAWRTEGMAEGAALLSLRTDKEKYNAGEKIEVTIPSSKSGKALVSIETGTGISDIFWVNTKEKQTSFTIDAKPEMAPNFYVHVSLIQPYGQTENDAPLRMYGVIPVLVENPETILKPALQVPDEIEPEKEYTIRVSETNRKEMTYTLAVVDEGLLALTNYKTPNPHSEFYAREALGVKTWDLYDEVAGAYGIRLEKAFAVGGDADLAVSGEKDVSRFKPVVQYAGPFTLKKGKTATHKFKMPNYVGEVRVMVVAGNNGAFGNSEASVPVRSGLMMLATAPRVLAPGEEILLPIQVFAMKENVKNVKVKVKTNPLLSVAEEDEKEIRFERTGDQMAFFKLKVNSATGAGKITAEAFSGSEKASYEINIEIRNPNAPVTVESSQIVEGNQSWETQLQVPGRAADAKAWIEISGFPSINLTKHINYLINYPHGCAEQIVSTALPQLFLEGLTELSDERKQEIEKYVRATLQKLPAYQLPAGGFAYWPGSAVADEWATSYAGHFMLIAEKSGYTLPVGLKSKWLSFQQTAARNYTPSESLIDGFPVQNFDFIQSYRLYTLALAGSPDMGAMNRLREKRGKPAITSWQLAAAYILAGQPDAGKKLIADLTTSIEEYREQSGTFGSALRDKAIILETLVLSGEKEKAFRLLQTIANEMNQSGWLNTQETAWCLMSASSFARKFASGSEETRFSLTVNGETTKLRSKIPVINIPVDLKEKKDIQVNYTNNGSSPNYVKVLARGVPAGIDTSFFSNNLVMQVKYYNSAGDEINPQTLRQGEDFKLEVTLKNPGIYRHYENLILNTIFPSGWEIMNRRIGDIPQEEYQDFDYQDIRDDRVYTYFNLEMNRQKTFVFYLNAAYAGRFYQPPVNCEAMYDQSVSAQQPGRFIEINRNQ